MPTRNINLTDHLDRFIEEISMENASEVVREGLWLLEQRKRVDQANLEWLRGAVQEGIDSIERGDYVTLRSDRDIADFVREIREGFSAKATSKKKRV